MTLILNHRQCIIDGIGRYQAVNGDRYFASNCDIVILNNADPSSGHHFVAITALHFGPPAGLPLILEIMKDFCFVSMPPGDVGSCLLAWT
jgi:hypothetical protein